MISRLLAAEAKAAPWLRSRFADAVADHGLYQSLTETMSIPF